MRVPLWETFLAPLGWLLDATVVPLVDRALEWWNRR